MSNGVWITSRVPLNHCPTCHAVIDAATSAGQSAMPKPGDVSVCIHCANVLEFDGELRLRVIDPEKLRSATSEQFQLIARLQQAAMQIIIDRANKRNG